jgi:cellulose synthase operon protein C
LRDLAAPGRLSAAQQEEVNRIILGYTLRLTEALREAGRLSEATELIRPALQRSDDVRLPVAMARIFKSAGDAAQALALLEKAIVREPDELGHRLLASELALAVKALEKAEGQAKAALELAPNHPRALAAAGRVEKTRGNALKAIEYFQRAQALERDKAAFSVGPAADTRGRSENRAHTGGLSGGGNRQAGSVDQRLGSLAAARSHRQVIERLRQ